jgi:hypothetical protein
MQISINVRGELVRQGAQNLSAEIPQIGRRQIRTRLERIKRRMQAYPRERAGQSVVDSHPVLGRTYTAAKRRYRRSGRLGRSWTIRNDGDKGYTLRNDARAPRSGTRYSRFVVGDAYGTGQAWMHKGRWQVMRDVVDEEIATLPPAVEREIEMVARRNNL